MGGRGYFEHDVELIRSVVREEERRADGQLSDDASQGPDVGAGGGVVGKPEEALGGGVPGGG
jgi:hypothetical protein